MTEALFEGAAAGRGFWAGLFPVTPSDPMLPPKGHVTLAHFGRDVSREIVEGVIGACRGLLAMRPPGPIVARSWGQARLDQSRSSVLALLLDGAELEELRQALVVACRGAGAQVDDRFAFHPHITIQRSSSRLPVTIRTGRRMEVRLGTLSLVCGNGCLDFSLGVGPF